MSSNNQNNFSDLGDQIKNLVSDAVNTLDFEQLNKNISETVNSALDEVHRQLNIGKEQLNRKTPGKTGYTYRTETKTEEGTNSQITHKYAQKPKQKPPAQVTRERSKSRLSGPQRVRLPIAKTPPGTVSGVLYIVFGAIGVGSFGLTVLILMLILLADPWMAPDGFLYGLMWSFFLLSTAMMSWGIHLRKRVKRFRGYVKVLGERTFCSVEELAHNSGRTKKYVVKDLKKMIRKRMFLEGALDEQETHFIATYETYKQYQSAQLEMRQRQMEEEHRQVKEQNRQEEIAKNEEYTEKTHKMITEGRECIRQIKIANDAIADIEMSNKLYRLELVISKIFAHIEEHPEQISEIQKFMDYYLPTTLKLVVTYQKLDGQPIQKDNITTAKQEIEKTLDTINTAFETLLDDLFQHVALDVTTDISVLETMFAREGLMEKDFR